MTDDLQHEHAHRNQEPRWQTGRSIAYGTIRIEACLLRF